MKKNYKLFTAFFSTFALLFAAWQPAIHADQVFDIEVRVQSGDYSVVESKVVHDGVIVIQDPDDTDGPRQLPLKVEASLNYEQRYTGKNEPLAIRRYLDTTRADLSISDGKRVSELTSKNRYLVTRIKEYGPTQFVSLEDVLTQREVELITGPADPLSFAALFNRDNVQVGQKWKVDANALSSFLAVDRVYDHEVLLQLREVNQRVAKVYIIGQAQAEVDDVTNTIGITGVALIDLDKYQLTDLRATFRQTRGVGQVAPGFKGTTKVDMKLTNTDSLPSLSNREISARTKSQRIARKVKWESNQGHFRLLYDPRWRMIASEDEGAILRYVQNGDLMAQCNIAQLPSRPANNLLSLKQFQTEVGKIIAAEQSARIINADTQATNDGSQVHLVKVNGVEQQVPVSWLYYHVGHRDGRQVTFVFTLEQQVANDFHPADQLLVHAFRFLPVPQSANAKTAKRDTTQTEPKR